MSAAEQKWAKVTFALRRTKFRRYTLGPLLKGAEVGEPEGGKLVLRFQSRTLRENVLQELQDVRSMEALQKAVEEVYGTPLQVALAPADDNGGAPPGQSAAVDSPLVRAALAMGARIVGEEEAAEK